MKFHNSLLNSISKASLKGTQKHFMNEEDFMSVGAHFHIQGKVVNQFKSINWSKHPLGDSKKWPEPLKILIKTMFHSKSPMNIYWGENRYFFYNDAFLPSLGKTEEIFLGRKGQEVFTDSWSVIESQLDRVVNDFESLFFEDILVPIFRDEKLEEVFWTYSLQPIFCENDTIGGVFGICAETSKSVKESIETENSLNQLTEFFMQSQMPMAVLEGPNHTFTLTNEPYTKLVARDVLGKNAIEAFSDDEIKDFVPLLDEVYKTGKPFSGKDLPLHIPDKNGNMVQHYIDVSYHPYRSINDEIIGVFAIIYDVTDKFLAKREAERANELKSAFLANMSHEIRTPIGAMLGFAELLRDPGLSNTERSNYLDILSRNGESLSIIINDILDLSKVEAGHLSLEYTDIYPKHISEDVISLLRVKAKEKDLALEFKCEVSDDDSIVADGNRVRQILLNIVGNAIKFTRFGTVKLHLYQTKSKLGQNTLCFEVADTGIGIPHSQRDNIFDMFVQADGTMTRRFGGTGLGLALSKKLTLNMGGDVSILKTKENIGTTFLIEILDQPAKKASQSTKKIKKADALKELTPESLDGVKVLVVEDSADNQRLFWLYLSSHGATIESAENGFRGYQAAMTSDFDIVLMDIQMPVMDGYTAVHKLRENGFDKPIIALTAHAMSEIKRKALNAGYTDYITKPVGAEKLVRMILQHLK